MRAAHAVVSSMLLLSGIACASATMPIENRSWTLVALRDRTITDADVQRPASITLSHDAGTPRLTGSSGCNSMFGSYLLDGSTLSFSNIGMTKMACVRGMDVESAFTGALAAVRHWHLIGNELAFTDSAGTVVARFASPSSR